jgi:hypothetical protein
MRVAQPEGALNDSRLPTSFIRWFADIGIEDLPSVGGKNASLGEMYC